MSANFSNGARLIWDPNDPPFISPDVIAGYDFSFFGPGVPPSNNAFCSDNPIRFGLRHDINAIAFEVGAIELLFGTWGNVGNWLQVDAMDGEEVRATWRCNTKLLPPAKLYATLPDDEGRPHYWYQVDHATHIQLEAGLSTTASWRFTTDTPPYFILTGYDDYGNPIYGEDPAGGYIGVMYTNRFYTAVPIPRWVPGISYAESDGVPMAVYSRPNIWWQVI